MTLKKVSELLERISDLVLTVANNLTMIAMKHICKKKYEINQCEDV